MDPLLLTETATTKSLELEESHKGAKGPVRGTISKGMFQKMAFVRQ